MARLPSGVAGFDEMVQGGLPESACIVLQGPPGQEKLRFALTFLAEGLRAGASGLVVVSSQSPDSVLGELRALGVDLDAVVAENRLRIVDWYTQRDEPVLDVEERGPVLRSSIDLTNVGVALSRAIAALGGDQPRRAIVELLSPAMSVFEVGQVYAFAQSSRSKFARFRYTALYLLEKEMHTASQLSTLHQPFDGVIEIERTREGDRIVRKIGVLHLKDTAPDAAFHVIQDTPKGLHVVREPVGGRPPDRRRRSPPPGSREPPPGEDEPWEAESEHTSEDRAPFIIRIAQERLKLAPADPDALFAIAAAQASMDEMRGALETVERLVKIDPRYPGLWALKAKLHTHLGDADKARASRVRSQEIGEAGDERSHACHACGRAIPVGETRCPNCGAAGSGDAQIVDELTALAQVGIQETLEAEEPPPGPDKLRKPPAPKSGPAGSKRGISPPLEPSGKNRKVDSRTGLTNGLVREKTAARATGMTNGLRGRTNGLTNGLKGRTNGLTNGLRGRTNGLTNGVRGRTNGLTNGLKGRTNGLTNGNGFTNGLGYARFRRETSVNRWKLYVIPLLSVVLLLLPLLGPTSLQTRAYPIAIDGSFGDWGSAALASVPPRAGGATNIDLVRFGVADNLDYLAFYFQVNGTALAGGGSPPTVDTFRAFIDVDRDPATGYAVRGHGADRLIELSGWGGAVNASTLWEWDTNRDPKDWNGWIKAASIPAAVAGASAEAQVDWLSLATDRPAMDVLLHAQAHDGSQDEADYVVSTTAGSLRVVKTPVAPEILSGSNVQLLRLDLLGAVRPVTYDALTVTLTGTAPTTSVSAVHLLDGNGSLLGDRIPMSNRIAFQFTPRSLGPGQSDRLFVVADVTAANGDTLRARVDAPLDVVAGDAAGTPAHPPPPP